MRDEMKDFFGRRIPSNIRIVFRRNVLAEALWEYGEDKLAGLRGHFSGDPNGDRSMSRCHDQI